MELVRIAKSKSSFKGDDVPLPGPLEPKTDREDWESKLKNALSARDGIDSIIPLSYVIRPFVRIPLPATVTAEEIRMNDLVNNAPLTGPAYNADRAAAFGILESLTLGQDSATWISRKARQTKMVDKLWKN